MFQSKAFRRFLEAWPGKRTFGIYRFLPVFFVFGAALEFSMINWHAGRAGEINFCKFDGVLVHWHPCCTDTCMN